MATRSEGILMWGPGDDSDDKYEESEDEEQEKPNLRSSVIITRKEVNEESSKKLRLTDCIIPRPDEPIDAAVKQWEQYIHSCTSLNELRDVVLVFTEEDLNIPLLKAVNDFVKQRGEEIIKEEKNQEKEQARSSQAYSSKESEDEYSDEDLGELSKIDFEVEIDLEDESVKKDFDEIPNLDDLVEVAEEIEKLTKGKKLR